MSCMSDTLQTCGTPQVKDALRTRLAGSWVLGKRRTRTRPRAVPDRASLRRRRADSARRQGLNSYSDPPLNL